MVVFLKHIRFPLWNVLGDSGYTYDRGIWYSSYCNLITVFWVYDRSTS